MESFVSDSGGSLSVIYHPMSIGKLFSSKLDKNLFWHTENLALMLLKSGLKLFLNLFEKFPNNWIFYIPSNFYILIYVILYIFYSWTKVS